MLRGSSLRRQNKTPALRAEVSKRPSVPVFFHVERLIGSRSYIYVDVVSKMVGYLGRNGELYPLCFQLLQVLPAELRDLRDDHDLTVRLVGVVAIVLLVVVLGDVEL